MSGKRLFPGKVKPPIFPIFTDSKGKTDLKEKILVLVFFLLGVNFVYGTENTPLREFNETIKNKRLYTREKEKRIALLRKLNISGLPLAEQFQINYTLYQEYRKFKIDTAILYVSRNLQLAHAMQQPQLELTAQIQLANLYSSLDKFLEAEKLLERIDHTTISRDLRIEYYDARIQFYEHYNTNSFNKTDAKQIVIYRDSLLKMLQPTSVRYQVNFAQKLIAERKLAAAKTILLRLLGPVKEQNADFAMVTYLLAYVNQLQHQPDQAKKYYMQSAIADIKNAIKDNASLQNLALMFYETGEIDQAYICTQSAIEDAIFCNVKFRTLQMSELYTIINTAYQKKEAGQKSQLQLNLVFISMLSVFLIIAVIYVYRQMKKVSRIKEELQISSRQLISLNQEINHTNMQLSETNARLFEANQVKEAYIAQFFDLCSAYIRKLEDYRKSLNKKAMDNQLDGLIRMLRSTTVVDNEAEELYHVFDTIFLGLYPDFIAGFNALLLPGEQFVLKTGELLNTELRIFALLRLGITDSVKIAAFLRYSISTIYNYRTKVRNKAAVSRDDFEKEVMKIGLLTV